MTTVLLTGFEPFAGDATNPSGEAVRLVASGWQGPERLVTEILPVTFTGAADRLRALMAAHEPTVVLAAGLAGGRSGLTFERVAVNLADARIPDNDGAQPVDEPSVAGAPAAYFATLPVKAMAAAVTDAGIAASVSHTAGTFVCNHTMFTALDAAPAGVRAGFVHTPWDTVHAPAGAPALSLDDIARGLTIALRAALDEVSAVPMVGGALH